MSRSAATKRRAAEIDAEMDARVRQIAERCGRAPQPVRTRIDPSVVRRLPPRSLVMGAPRISNAELELVLAFIRDRGEPVAPGTVRRELDLPQERLKTILKLLTAAGDLEATGKTSQRRYSIPAAAGHDQPAEQPQHVTVTPAENGGVPPVADTPDLDDPDDQPAPPLAAVADITAQAGENPLGRYGDGHPANEVNAEFTLTIPKVEYRPRLEPRPSVQTRYTQLLLDRLETTENGEAADLMDRVERLILLDLADRPDAEALIDRARTIGAIR